MTIEGVKTVNIDSNGVEYFDKEKNIRIKWNEIAYVIINKYTICFLPSPKTNIIISITNEYKKEVMEGLAKYNKTTLLIDNVN